MPREEELCALKVFRETWRMLNRAESIEDAKARFKELIVELILGKT